MCDFYDRFNTVCKGSLSWVGEKVWVEWFETSYFPPVAWPARNALPNDLLT
jgi:hypothetical protein